MKIKAVSSFKSSQDYQILEKWNADIQQLYGTKYERIDIKTSLGNTVVWALNNNKKDFEPLVIFPGARTCAMFWEMNNVLENLKNDYRIYLVDVNGQPSLSDGNTPDITSKDYGFWAAEVLKGLGLQKATVAGASLGGLICLKLCLVAPQMVDKAILLNPAGLGNFSLSIKNLYYNILPIVSSSRKNVEKFLENAVLYNQNHNIPTKDKELLVDFQMLALTKFKDKTDKPSKGIPAKELNQITSKIYLIVGDKDILFPYQKSVAIAKKELKNLQQVFVIKDTGHGIELSKEALVIVKNIMREKNISSVPQVNLSISY